ncbi:MAG: HAMP domain-containing sensor histidine kinase [bacterium]|nr:HAMP domain-containing sensor histidine kinase [bacterium]
MKHRLQWKFIGIMFFSVFIGVAAMAVAENAFPGKSYLLNLMFLIVTALVFFLMSRPLIRRIENMNDNIEKIANGQMRGLNTDKHQDELGSLSCHINKMAMDMEKSLQKERNMVCNLAHDLRTPITSICGYVELLEKQEELSPQSRQYTDIILRKSMELSEQVSQLLEYSLLTFQEKEYEMRELSISSLLEQVLIDFIPTLEKEGFTYYLKGNQNPCTCIGNQNLLIRLFDNLITNSIRYGKGERRIELELSEENKKIVIYISNYGETLSKEEEEHIFDYLYQGQSGKSYQTESKGLGLSIAKEIVKIHNGAIQVSNDSDLHKVTFEITLKRE